MSALIFDCDGVLADTERYGHLPAFNQAFREFGIDVSWSEEEYASRVLIGGGKERIASVLTPEFIETSELPTDPEAQRDLVALWHSRKTEIYRALVAEGRMPARPGIPRLVAEAVEAGYELAVASTSAEASVRSVLEMSVGADAASRFRVFAGDVVARKKPAPDIYLLALRELDLLGEEAVVIEDSSNGLRAALGAGLRTVVTVSSYTRDENFDGAALVVSSLGDPGGEAIQVLDDSAEVGPGAWVTIDDIDAILATDRVGNH